MFWEKEETFTFKEFFDYERNKDNLKANNILGPYAGSLMESTVFKGLVENLFKFSVFIFKNYFQLSLFLLDVFGPIIVLVCLCFYYFAGVRFSKKISRCVYIAYILMLVLKDVVANL